MAIRRSVEKGGAVAVVPPLPLTTYTATWSARGKEAFWTLTCAFTAALMQGNCNLTAFSYDETDDSVIVTFTVRADIQQIVQLNEGTPEEIEKKAIGLGTAEPFDLGTDLRPQRYQETIYLGPGDNPCMHALACWMTAMIRGECRLLIADAGGGKQGCYFDFTLGGTGRQLDLAQEVVANYFAG